MEIGDSSPTTIIIITQLVLMIVNIPYYSMASQHVLSAHSKT